MGRVSVQLAAARSAEVGQQVSEGTEDQGEIGFPKYFPHASCGVPSRSRFGHRARKFACSS